MGQGTKGQSYLIDLAMQPRKNEGVIILIAKQMTAMRCLVIQRRRQLSLLLFVCLFLRGLYSKASGPTLESGLMPDSVLDASCAQAPRPSNSPVRRDRHYTHFTG